MDDLHRIHHLVSEDMDKVEEAWAREFDPVNGLHLIHHPVTEDMDKVEVGSMEGDICARLRMQVFPGKDMWVLGRGLLSGQEQRCHTSGGACGRRRWFSGCSGKGYLGRGSGLQGTDSGALPGE